MTGIAVQGFSVAASADGNTAIVGGPADDRFTGAVWIWTRSAGVWTQQGVKLVGSGAVGGGEQQGSSVALSADGNTAIVGGPGDDNFTGSAWIWTRSGGVWTQQGPKLVGSDAVGGAAQGQAVALSADGNTALVGGFNDNSGTGAVWVWTRSAGVWTQQGAKLVATDAAGPAEQGTSVALAADGDTAVVGGSADDGFIGAAWVWTRSGGVWHQQGTKLVGSDGVGGSNQGWAVSVSGDGTTLIVGAPGDNSDVGAAWVWTKSGATWIQQGLKLVGSGGSSANQGASVSIAGDGNTAIVGGVGDNVEEGATWAWSRSAGLWTQRGSKIVGTGASGAAQQGWSAALSRDGITAIVGGLADNSGMGAAWVFLLAPPAVITHPASQTVTPGSTATFTAAASGAHAVQWQKSSNGGASFQNISGATSTTYAFTAAASDGDAQFRAAFTNSSGSTASNAATLTVTLPPALPTMSIDKTTLRFGAVTTGTAFSSRTDPQTVQLRQNRVGTVTWTAVSTTPWLVVSPASGIGSATLTVATQFVPGLTESQTGRIILTFTGAGNTAGPIDVTLTTVPASAAVSIPFGTFDTPAGDATVLAGSIAVTGWALDNIGVRRLELWRDLQPGETTAPFASTPSDPRSGKVFIGNATFVDGARPDIEALYPSMPLNRRAGWGYLLLTWGLWNQGNGTYQLHAFAFDQENNVATIGAKTILVNNNATTRPFGTIDTPDGSGEPSGPSFGWALTPKVNGTATCKIQPSGVQVSIDSGPLQPVVYGDARSDIAGAFPGFSNATAAGGYFIFDWSTLANGTHTIGWLVTDDCNRVDGVGSRFFNVTTGVSAVTAAPSDFRLKAETSSDADFRLKAETTELGRGASAFLPDSVLVSRGYGELPEILAPGETGSRTIEVQQGGRIEVRLPRGFESAYQLVSDGDRRALPAGSTWDAASGTFYWQPAAGFLGRYQIVFSNGTERISVAVVITP